jgi:hypothetical protein
MTATTHHPDLSRVDGRPPRTLAKRLTLVAAAALAVAGVTAAGGQAHAARPALGALPGATPVTVLTGDRAILGGTAAHPTARLIPARATGAGSLSTLRMAGDTYLIPASARPYLGRYLDPSLFDVTRLAAARTNGRVPISLTYTGTAAPVLPGVTLTSAAAGHARGYLTAASAKTFGAALAKQAVADSAAGWPDRSSLFGSVTGLTADIAPVQVTPQFPQVTLIVRGVDHAGKPLRFGFGFLTNSDNAAKGGGFILIINGEARLSLPLGHYSALLEESTFGAGEVFTSRLAIRTDYDLTSNGQTLTLDARTATSSSPTVSTPRPTRIQEIQAEINLADAKNQVSVIFGFSVVPPSSRAFFTPVGKPAVGRVFEISKVSAVDSAVPGGRFSYDGAWQDEGVPAAQHHTVPSTGLARVDAGYNSDLPVRLGGTGRFVIPPEEFFAFGTYFPTPMPLQRTEFVFGPAGSIAEDFVLMDITAFDDPGFVDDFTFYPVTPGARRAQNWFGTPYSLTPFDDQGACFVCRTDTSMVVAVNLHDSEPAHQAELFTSPDGTPVAHFKVFKDGVLLLSEKDSLGDLFDVPAAAADYRVVSDATRVFQGARLSTTMIDEVTFSSAAGQGKPEAPGAFCPLTADGTGCRVLPVLKAHLDLHPTLTGGVPVGQRVFDLDVDHINGAAKTAIGKVTVEVRPTGASTWTVLPVKALGGTSFAAVFDAKPAQAGKTMDVRVTAADAVGSTLKQTTLSAFVIGG